MQPLSRIFKQYFIKGNLAIFRISNFIITQHGNTNEPINDYDYYLFCELILSAILLKNFWKSKLMSYNIGPKNRFIIFMEKRNV
jgi:hypothetical protein